MLNKLNKVESVLYYTLMIFLAFLLISPFIYMVSISLASPATNAQATFTYFPREFYFANYLNIFVDQRLLRWTMNSFIITGFSIVGQVFSSAIVAYGFARLQAKGKTILFMILLTTMMIPGQITMIPTFILFRNLGWYNTQLPLIVPNFFGHAFNIFLIRQFIVRISKDLDDSAKIDGLGHIGTFWYIILPQIKPVLLIIAVFTFNSSWGDFFGPLLYIRDIDKTTLAYGVRLLSTPSGQAIMPEWNVVMVASMLLTIPMMIVFYVSQKRIFEDDSIVIGGTK